MSGSTEMADKPDLEPEKVIELRHPVEFAGQTYTSLTLREPTAAQWQEWDKLEGVEADIKAVATVSGLPLAAVRLVAARDLIAASRYIGAFLS